MSNLISERDALKSLFETASFAADILARINQDKALGVGSFAGQSMEAESRLRAAVELVKASDKRWIENETRLRVLKALKLDESYWRAGSMHSHGALCFVETEADTIADALLIAERANPVSLANTAEYKSSFWPLDDFEARAKIKTYRDNEPFDVTPYIACLNRTAEYSAAARSHPRLNPATFQLRFTVKIETATHGVEFVQYRVNVKNFAPIVHTFRMGNGGYVSAAENYQAHFSKRYMLWAERGTPNDFVLVA